MPSVSYRNWRTTRRAVLNAVEAAHATIHGTGIGRREATRQLNHGYTMLLAAEFQGFCRELHTEAIQHFVATLPATQQNIVSEEFTFNRQLDKGNATPASIGSDFGRLGLKWWAALDKLDPAAANLRRQLESLNNWRNAIAHNNFDPLVLGGTMRLRLAMVQEWRWVCNRFARLFDELMVAHLVTVTGRRPW
ncbi:Uncharacterized protein OS=Mycobacterium abscessus subsp. bolletii 50594 GN=MASS_1p0056 PE=4 SV=1 [Gemmataceae bacterium]|nr:Uncharacterized protein OS=Mycobacterium abscessus subsp. bolletii 50594 GN=MASS_1p0056 PE=4 SV=1 [Gemmataceae bacterium]VTU00496.1 Uncharacterized protein OS=Mycobacterium abscessus subsp. bolletii 50594 GN=MASS_1p0056 PE=4 SV=1 [Gemmataceae bacterium]